MQSTIETKLPPKPVRKRKRIGKKRFNDVFELMHPFLGEWQHAVSLAKRLSLAYWLVAAALRKGVEVGLIEATRTNPTSYRLAGVSANLPQPDAFSLDEENEFDMPIESLRWLTIHLGAPSTMDALCNSSRTQIDQIVEHLEAGIAHGYVFVEGNDVKTYTLIEVNPESFSRGQVEIQSLRRRMETHLKGERTSGQLVKSMGLTRERVRQLLERAERRGIIERLDTRPQRFRMRKISERVCQETNAHPILDDDIRSLPITTRSINILNDSGVQTVGELVSMERDQVRALPRMGKKSLDEIVLALMGIGLTLGESAL